MKFIRSIYLLVLVFIPILSPETGFCQSTAEVAGEVINAATGEKLVGAQVHLLKTFLGDVTDSRGRFQISHIPAGRYQLKISYIGFSAREIPMVLRAGEIRQLTVSLEPTPIPMNQLVVVGSRHQELLEEAAASVHVLSSRELKTRHNFRLEDAISYVPGVQVVGESINIRGGSGYNRLGGSRVLVLLDEVPILTSDLNNVNWNLVPITAVAQVEVLKGAASSLFGSGALSGVIDVRMKAPEAKTHFSVYQSVGIYDRPSIRQWQWTDRTLHFTRTDIGLNKQFGHLGIRADLSRFSTTGDREMGGLVRHVLSCKSVLTINANSRLIGFFTYSFEKRELFLRWLSQNQALRVPPSDRANRLNLSGFMGYLKWKHLFSPKLSFDGWIAYNRQLLGVPMSLTSAFRPALGWSGSAQWHWFPYPRHQVTIGLDAREDRVESKYYGKRRAVGASPFIHDAITIGSRFRLDLGLRLDTYNLVGDSLEKQLSPRIGISVQPFTGSTLHMAYGKAFRAASVVERFLSVDEGGDVRVLANPDLPPESSRLLDFGLRQQVGKSLYLETTFFFTRYLNLIELTLIPSNLSVQFLSYPKAAVDGIEMLVRWGMPKKGLSVTASATWMDARYLETGRPLPYRPRFIGFISPEWHVGSWRLGLDFRYVSRIQEVLVYPKDERVPVKLWNIRCDYKWRNLSFQLLIKNAGNYNYTLSERVLGEIRNFIISVQGNF